MVAHWNFHAAQVGIVERIKAFAQTGPDAWARAVGTRKELAAVAEEMQVTPAVYVVYDGFAVLAADEFSASLSHRWLVVLALGTAASQKEAEPLDQLAGPYIGQLIEHLHGYTPPQCVQPLVLATPPRPYYSPARFAYYPLLFITGSAVC